MREIRFRGRRTDGCNNWVYGSLVTDGDKAFIISSYRLRYNNVLEPVAHEVYPESVNQYTGHKDNQDKEIYGGDIISLTYGIPSTSDRLIIEYTDNEVVDDVFVSGWWMRNTVKHRHSSSLCKTYEGDIEVIGNIDDNPELI